MGVKNKFLKDFINEKIYVEQPPTFKFKKAFYKLIQAIKSQYEKLITSLIPKDFHMGKIDFTLFIKHKDSNFNYQLNYIGDILFASSYNQ